MNNKTNLKRNTVIAIVSGLGVSLLLTYTNDFNKLKDRVLDAPIWLIPLGFLLYFLIYIVDTFRLKIVTRSFGYNVKNIDLVANGVLGCFYSNITPFAAGGQPYQIYQLTQCGVRSDISTAIILTRFSEYLLTSIAVSLGALIYISQNEAGLFSGTPMDYMLYIGLIVSLTVTFFILLSIFKTSFMLRFPVKILDRLGRKVWALKLKDFALEMNSAVSRIWLKSRNILGVDTLAGFLNLLLQGLSLWVVLEVLCVNVPGPFFITMLFTLMNLIVYFLPTPGASGGIEALYSVVFAYFTKDLATTTAAVILWRFSTYYLHIIFQIIFNLFYNRRTAL